MANPEHLKILERGVKAWNLWRKAHFHRRMDPAFGVWKRPDLSFAELEQRDLRRIDLRGINLDYANLSGSDLRRAQMGGAWLRGAKLHADLRIASFRESLLEQADLAGADIHNADFHYSYLDRANLRGADLGGADMRGARFGRCDFTEVCIGYTVFGFNNLSEVKGLDTVYHRGPSTIGLDTIYESQGKIPEVFLRGAGVPEDFITYIRSLVGRAIDFYSCFISYSSQDADFTQRLYADLQAKNVRCWKFDENAKWGEPVWGEIDTAIRHYDKLVVICSRHSLQSPPVIREIERALQKEDREHRNVLFPVRIDDYLFDEWDHPRTADVVSKVIGDFRGSDNLANYAKAFPRFLDALNRPQQGTKTG
jgi:uncharacterized protein YjbI with pentapeptide repeats